MINLFAKKLHETGCNGVLQSKWELFVDNMKNAMQGKFQNDKSKLIDSKGVMYAFNKFIENMKQADFAIKVDETEFKLDPCEPQRFQSAQSLDHNLEEQENSFSSIIVLPTLILFLIVYL